MKMHSFVGLISGIILAVSIGSLWDITRSASTPMIFIIGIVGSVGGLGWILGKIADGVNNKG